MDTRPVITESQFEAMVDREVWARLASDPCYKFAECAEAQAGAEEAISEQVAAEFHARYAIAGQYGN